MPKRMVLSLASGLCEPDTKPDTRYDLLARADMAAATYDLLIICGGIGGWARAAVMARAGASVLVLEASAEFPDRVRGEWIAPWGVAETRRLGLYDLLVGAGGHHIMRHATYDETLDP